MRLDFRSFKVGDHIKFDDQLEYQYIIFPDAQRWDEEPARCLMEIVSQSSNHINFSCLEECGRHCIDQLTKEEYEEYSDILGTSIIRHSSINEAVQSLITYQFDPQEAAKDILAMIASELNIGGPYD